MKRKASMSLGVNSIVVLIIAVIVLGLVIGFINRMFTRVSRIPLPECTPETPSGTNKLTFCPSTVIASPGESVSMKAMYFCTKDTEDTCESIKMSGSCGDTGVTFESNSRDINGGETGEFIVILKTPSNLGKGSYLCTLKAEQGDNNVEEEKDFVLKIE